MNLDVGFIVLCPDKDLPGLRSTVSSLQCEALSSDVCCVVPSDTTARDMQGFEAVCPTYKGKDTITSLINAGMQKLQHDWGFMIYAGSRLKTNLQRKLELFIKSDRDVMFPIVNGITNFVEGSSNGVLISKGLFKDAGEFPTIKRASETVNDFELAKLMWADEAMKKGCQFKAIAGMKIC